MAYSTIDDQKNEIPAETIRQLVDDENVGSLTPTDVIARYNQNRDDADGEIDAMLAGGGYATPVTGPAAALTLLRSWSKIITAYKLFKRKDSVPDARQKEYDRVMRSLDKVAAGNFKLPGVTAGDDAAETGVGMGVITSSRFSTSGTT